MVIIPELEARSHLPKDPNPAPAAGTQLPLSSGLSMTKEPGLSNSSQHHRIRVPVRGARSPQRQQFSSEDVTDVSASSRSAQNHIHRDKRVKVISATG